MQLLDEQLAATKLIIMPLIIERQTINKVQDLDLNEFVAQKFGNPFVFMYQGGRKTDGVYKYTIPLGDDAVLNDDAYTTIARGDYGTNDPAHILHALYVEGEIEAGEYWIEIFY